MFPANVERWRDNVVIAISKSNLYSAFDPVALLIQEGLSLDSFVDLVLGIIHQESSGNNFCLGDLKPGVKIPHQPKTYEECAQWIDGANSIGLMQLNYGVGTPQQFGFTGKKLDLTDPDINILYGVLYFEFQIKRYLDQYDTVQDALSAYNAGHAIESNRASYADAIINFVKAAATGIASVTGEKKT